MSKRISISMSEKMYSDIGMMRKTGKFCLSKVCQSAIKKRVVAYKRKIKEDQILCIY